MLRDLFEISVLVIGGLLVSTIGLLMILLPYFLGAPAWSAFPMTPVVLIAIVFALVQLDL